MSGALALRFQAGPGVGGALPPPPTRDDMLASFSPFQGVTVTTRQYGTYPVFGPDLNNLEEPADRVAFYNAIRGAGGDICQISWAGETYSEPDFTYPVPGPGERWVHDLPGFCDRLAEILTVGQFRKIQLMLPGDGETGTTRQTYGRQYILDHAPALVQAMRSYRRGDLTKYTLLVPGYDGVWYGWKDAQAVLDYGNFMRSLLPDGFLGLEFGGGICHLGAGKDDYTKPGGLSSFDVFLQEYAYPPASNLNQVWQINARMLGPKYRRPPNQPADADPGAPFASGSANDYLSAGTPRGPFAFWPWEMNTFGWVRDQRTLQEVNDDRAYQRSTGARVAG